MLGGHLDFVHCCTSMIVDIAPAAPADLPLGIKPITLDAEFMEDAMRFFI
jgi:hypothetical protein